MHPGGAVAGGSPPDRPPSPDVNPTTPPNVEANILNPQWGADASSLTDPGAAGAVEADEPSANNVEATASAPQQQLSPASAINLSWTWMDGDAAASLHMHHDGGDPRRHLDAIGSATDEMDRLLSSLTSMSDPARSQSFHLHDGVSVNHGMPDFVIGSSPSMYPIQQHPHPHFFQTSPQHLHRSHSQHQQQQQQQQSNPHQLSANQHENFYNPEHPSPPIVQSSPHSGSFANPSLHGLMSPLDSGALHSDLFTGSPAGGAANCPGQAQLEQTFDIGPSAGEDWMTFTTDEGAATVGGEGVSAGVAPSSYLFPTGSPISMGSSEDEPSGADDVTDTAGFNIVSGEIHGPESHSLKSYATEPGQQVFHQQQGQAFHGLHRVARYNTSGRLSTGSGQMHFQPQHQRPSLHRELHGARGLTRNLAGATGHVNLPPRINVKNISQRSPPNPSSPNTTLSPASPSSPMPHAFQQPGLPARHPSAMYGLAAPGFSTSSTLVRSYIPPPTLSTMISASGATPLVPTSPGGNHPYQMGFPMHRRVPSYDGGYVTTAIYSNQRPAQPPPQARALHATSNGRIGVASRVRNPIRSRVNVTRAAAGIRTEFVGPTCPPSSPSSISPSATSPSSMGSDHGSLLPASSPTIAHPSSSSSNPTSATNPYLPRRSGDGVVKRSSPLATPPLMASELAVPPPSMHPLPPTNVGEAVARHQQQHHPGAADFSVGTAPLTPTKTPVTLPTQVAGAVAMAALPAAGMPVGMAGGLPRNASTSSASSQGSASGLLAIRRRVSASEVKLSAALAGGGRNPSAPTSANSSANSSASSSPATSPQGRPGMIGGLTAVGGGKTRASLTGNSMGAATRRVGAAPQLVAAGSAYLNSHHRVSDFKRREELKHCFDGLLTVLPEKPPTGDEAGEAQETPAPAKKGKKKASAAAAEEKVEKRPPNRVEILWRALDYMTALSGRVEEMEGTIQGLTAELQRLRVEKGITVVENEIEAMEEDVPVEEEAVLVG